MSLFGKCRAEQRRMVDDGTATDAIRVDIKSELALQISSGDEWLRAVGVGRESGKEGHQEGVVLRLRLREAFVSVTRSARGSKDAAGALLVSAEARDADLLDLSQGLRALGRLQHDDRDSTVGDGGACPTESMVRVSLCCLPTRAPQLGVYLGALDVNLHQVTAQLLYDIVRALQTCAGTPNPNSPLDAFEIGATTVSLAAYGKAPERIEGLREREVRVQVLRLLNAVAREDRPLRLPLPRLASDTLPARHARVAAGVPAGATVGKVFGELGRAWGLPLVRAVGIRWLASTLSRSSGWRGLSRCVHTTGRATSYVVRSGTSALGMVAGSGLAGAAWLLAGVSLGRRSSQRGGGEQASQSEEEEEESVEEGFERIGVTVLSKGWSEVPMPREDEFLLVGQTR